MSRQPHAFENTFQNRRVSKRLRFKRAGSNHEMKIESKRERAREDERMEKDRE